MNTEILAQLAPRNARLDGAGGAGIAALTPMDIAGGLAGAPAGGQLAVLAAYAGQWEVVPELCTRIGRAVGRLARAERWRGMTPGRVEVLARLAVREFVAPPLCGGCEGRGIQWAPDPSLGLGDCEECGGSGSGRMSGSVVCEALGVDGEEWRGVWRGRYDRAFAIVAGWGSEALSTLARRLG
jgi:hypothetical protein